MKEQFSLEGRFLTRVTSFIPYLYHYQRYMHQIQHRGHPRKENRPCLKSFLLLFMPLDNDNSWKCSVIIKRNVTYSPRFRTILLFLWPWLYQSAKFLAKLLYPLSKSKYTLNSTNLLKSLKMKVYITQNRLMLLLYLLCFR